MASIRSYLVGNLLVKGYMRKIYDPSRYSIEQIRKKTENLSKQIKIPSGTTIEPISIDYLSAEWIKADNVPINDDKVILYFHSGGFCLAYGNMHRDLAEEFQKPVVQKS